VAEYPHCRTNLRLIDELAPKLGGNSRKLITFVKDRPGHDRRYAIDASKIEHTGRAQPTHSREHPRKRAVVFDNQEWVGR